MLQNNYRNLFRMEPLQKNSILSSMGWTCSSFASWLAAFPEISSMGWHKSSGHTFLSLILIAFDMQRTCHNIHKSCPGFTTTKIGTHERLEFNTFLRNSTTISFQICSHFESIDSPIEEFNLYHQNLQWQIENISVREQSSRLSRSSTNYVQLCIELLTFPSNADRAAAGAGWWLTTVTN